MNGYSSLGFYVLGILYVIFGLGSLITGYVVNKIGAKWTMTISTVGYLQFVM